MSLPIIKTSARCSSYVVPTPGSLSRLQTHTVSQEPAVPGRKSYQDDLQKQEKELSKELRKLKRLYIEQSETLRGKQNAMHGQLQFYQERRANKCQSMQRHRKKLELEMRTIIYEIEVGRSNWEKLKRSLFERRLQLEVLGGFDLQEGFLKINCMECELNTNLDEQARIKQELERKLKLLSKIDGEIRDYCVQQTLCEAEIMQQQDIAANISARLDSVQECHRKMQGDFATARKTAEEALSKAIQADNNSNELDRPYRIVYKTTLEKIQKDIQEDIIEYQNAQKVMASEFEAAATEIDKATKYILLLDEKKKGLVVFRENERQILQESQREIDRLQCENARKLLEIKKIEETIGMKRKQMALDNDMKYFEAQYDAEIRRLEQQRSACLEKLKELEVLVAKVELDLEIDDWGSLSRLEEAYNRLNNLIFQLTEEYTGNCKRLNRKLMEVRAEIRMFPL